MISEIMVKKRNELPYCTNIIYVLCEDFFKGWCEEIVKRGDNQGGITNHAIFHNAHSTTYLIIINIKMFSLPFFVK